MDPKLQGLFDKYDEERLKGNFTKCMALHEVIVETMCALFDGEARYCYALTLTTTDGDTKEQLEYRIKKIHKSALVSPFEFKYSIEHEESNLHAHIYLTTNKYIKARDILRMNSSRRVDVKQLKGMQRAKWLNYIAKEAEVVSL